MMVGPDVSRSIHCRCIWRSERIWELGHQDVGALIGQSFYHSYRNFWQSGIVFDIVFAAHPQEFA
jgi:hypothetical protein